MMFFCERYSTKMAELCNGCKSGKVAPSAHNVCKMSEVTDEMIIQKLEESQDGDGDLLTAYIVKDTLMNNEKWKQKLKSKICKYI